MGASAAESPTSPDESARGLRASDAERDEVAARLKDEFVAGRLSHDTFVRRMDAVLEARQQADLPPLVADLPGQAQPRLPAPQPAAAARYRVAPATGPHPLVSWIRGALSRVRGQARRDPRSGQGGSSGPVAAPRAAVPRGAERDFSIGRDASCDLAIADMTVSRRHATLERTPDGWLISDLESTNGTRVNGWRVRGKVTVKAGDLISFGNLEAVFAREDTVPPIRPPAVPPTAPPADTPAPGVP